MVCPICGKGELHPTGRTNALADTLRRWREDAGIAAFDETYIDNAVRGSAAITSLDRCDNCGFARFNPVIAGDAAFYEAITTADYYVDERWEYHVAAVDLQRPQVRRVLDIGGGSGLFLRFLCARMPGLSLYGYEISPSGQANLKANGFGLIENLPDEPLPEQRFDAITVLQVLEHVSDPMAFLAKLSRQLNPGGMLILTTPDAEGPVSHFPDALTEVPPHHVTQWTERAFRSGLASLGFGVEAVRREPLPSYLWETYLPYMWHEDIWPALKYGSADCRRPDVEPMDSERLKEVRMAIDTLMAAGVKWLAGVPGHTIYVQAVKAAAPAQTSAQAPRV
jgi:2-polyprenyl-3-methyl-5-hydroxy-6-metoxy-1,4-benzoquinol methylase